MVEAPLGKGGMAEVYQVRDVTDGSRHALKVLTNDDEVVRKRILQEGELQATLSSPHIVKVTGELRVDGQPALLMELIRGPTLNGLLKCRDLEIPEAMTLFRGICLGVGHAHSRGMVHRDLKPANVLLAIEGDRLVPKVTDFGIAKDLASDSNLTAAHSAIGTPRFMAPEQLDDTATVDRRADMWSLGCILYRMVCGRHAFPRGQDLLLRVVTARYDPPSKHVSRLPAEVDFALHELLCGDVENRIPDVPTLFGILDGRTSLKRDAALGTLPVRARPAKTSKPTTLAAADLPEELRQVMNQRADWERAMSAAEAGGVQAPPPPPPWMAGESLLPRTMSPSSIQRQRGPKGEVEIVELDSLAPPALRAPTPEPAPRSAVEPADSAVDHGEPADALPPAVLVAVGAALGAFAVVGVVAGLWAIYQLL